MGLARKVHSPTGSFQTFQKKKNWFVPTSLVLAGGGGKSGHRQVVLPPAACQAQFLERPLGVSHWPLQQSHKLRKSAGRTAGGHVRRILVYKLLAASWINRRSSDSSRSRVASQWKINR